MLYTPSSITVFQFVSVHNDLLEHSDTHSFTYCLQLQQTVWPTKPKMFAFYRKTLQNPELDKYTILITINQEKYENILMQN